MGYASTRPFISQAQELSSLVRCYLKVSERPTSFLPIVEILETRAGDGARNLLEPFACAPLKAGQPDILNIQDAGKVIAKHIGLSDLTFIIAVTTQAPSVAGHIELRYGSSQVFIEISRDVCEYKDAVLSTLSHELSHKFLHANSIRFGSTQLEQELLTDVTAVYLGMGKIMLNGCECRSSEAVERAGTRTKTTHTLRTGYLSRDSFAFVYRLICAMRQTPAEEILSGLSQAARQAVTACERKYEDFFNSEYHTFAGSTAVTENLQRSILDCQEQLAQQEKTARRAGEKLAILRAAIGESHRPLREATDLIVTSAKEKEKASLRFLRTLQRMDTVGDLVSQSYQRLDGLRSDTREIASFAKMMESEVREDVTEVVECPIDRTKLRIPGNRNKLLVTCPECKYKFIATTDYNTGPPTTGADDDREVPDRLKSLSSLFRRKQKG